MSGKIALISSPNRSLGNVRNPKAHRFPGEGEIAAFHDVKFKAFAVLQVADRDVRALMKAVS